jgi:hypothetical protein
MRSARATGEPTRSWERRPAAPRRRLGFATYIPSRSAVVYNASNNSYSATRIQRVIRGAGGTLCDPGRAPSVAMLVRRGAVPRGACSHSCCGRMRRDHHRPTLLYNPANHLKTLVHVTLGLGVSSHLGFSFDCGCWCTHSLPERPGGASSTLNKMSRAHS